MLIIEANLDEHTPPRYHTRPLINAIKNEGNNLIIKEIETDHFASDKRKELIKNVLEF